jgi:hypothetical protein
MTARNGPAIAPKLPPAAIAPNRRFPCSGRNVSTMKLQKMDTTNRLKTDTHTKKTRATQTSEIPARSRNRNIRRFNEQNRYTIGMILRRGKRATTAE